MKIYVSLSKKNKKLLKYAILFILGCILIYYTNFLDVKAATIGSASIYSCNASDTVVNSTYSYLLDGDFYNGYLGTTYQGVMQGFNINFNASIQQGNTYTLDLYANTGDWRNISSETIQVFGSLGSKTCSNNVNAYTVTSVSATYYKITITFISNSTASYSQLSLANLNGNPLTGITNWKIDSLVLTDYGNSNTSDIIDNQNKQTETIIQNDKENTQDIIDNNDSNTQDIIDNQNKNNEELKDTIEDNLASCRPSNNLINFQDKSGTSSFYYVEHSIDYSMSVGKTYTLSLDVTSTRTPFAFTVGSGTTGYAHDIQNKQNLSNGRVFITFTPTETDLSYGTKLFFRFPRYATSGTSFNYTISNVMLVEGTSKDYEPYGQDICSSKLDDTNDKLDDLNDNITSSDTSGADSEANNFFNDFESNDFGLSDIITLPLTTIQSITSKSCTPLSLTIPFVNKTFELPCMTTIYSKFEPFYSIYQTITFGVISYWVCVQIYAMVKGFKDPAKDEIEVMDL